MNKKEVLKWFIALSIMLVIVSSSIIISFVDNKLYEKGYEKNGAYERLNKSVIDAVTKNTQNYFLGTQNNIYFYGEQGNHLEEVKQKIRTTLIITIIILILSISGIIYLKKKEHISIIKRTGIILIGISIIFLIFGLFWDWMFITFHKLLFKGQWFFDNNTLMMQLWGFDFFKVIASIIWLRIISIGIILWGLGKWLENRKKINKIISRYFLR